MHGDFSRPKFVSDRPFTRVTQLQGRIGLDADFNTHALLQHDRDVATRIDVIGESGVPKYGGGFALAAAAGATDLTISKGRIYLHGFICELSADTPFTKQPYFPGTTLTLPPNNGVTIIYLEVWELHRTGVDAPEILDPALDGRDTSGRVQTVFQVKAVNAPAGTGCVVPATVTAGKGTLTVPQVVPTVPADPCALNAEGGYRGLDNRLYRVEIHAPGNSGTATYKWSRDNGAVVYPLKSGAPLGTTVTGGAGGNSVAVTLSLPPRDDVLALHNGQWVELLDDETEYRSEPGPLLKIDKDPVLTPDGVGLSLAIPATATVKLPGGTHPRVRRWDGASGAQKVGAAEVLLEDDIKIQFGGSDLRTGDYWTFTARANGNAVDELKNESPHGITRYRTPLGVVTWLGGQIKSITDCRKPFPPLTELPTPTGGNTGCCTFTAGDVNGLIKAVNDANAATGTVRVCVLPGEYDLSVPLDITRRDDDGPLILTGCGRASHITCKKGPAVRVRGAANVVVEKLALSGLTAVLVEAGVQPNTGGIVRSKQVMIDSCRLTDLEKLWAVLAQGDDLEVSENTCAGGIGIGPSSYGVRVERNTVRGGRHGVGIGAEVTGLKATDKNSDAMQVVVRGNSLTNCSAGGVSVLAPLPLTDKFELPVATDLDVLDNEVTMCGVEAAKNWPRAGILVARTAGVRIAGNTVRYCGQKKHAVGIFAALVGHIEVTGNTVLDNGSHEVSPKEYQGGIVILGAVGGLPNASGSEIPKRYGYYFSSLGLAAVTVTDNRVVCPLGPALLVSGVGPAVVTGNTLVTRGLGPWPADDAAGFLKLADDLKRMALTAVAVGPLPLDDRASFLKALDADSRLRFEGNQVTLAVGDVTGSEYGYVCWPADAAVSDNQLLARTTQGSKATAHLVVAVAKTFSDTDTNTVRVIGNRVVEVPPKKDFTSLLVETTQKQPPVIVALNQTTGEIRVGVPPLSGVTPLPAAAAPFATGNQRNV